MAGSTCNLQLQTSTAFFTTRYSSALQLLFLFPSHPLPSSFTFAPLFTFGYPRSPHPSFFGFHVFILAQRSSLSWTGSAEMRKPGAQQEKGECANSTLASDGSLSLDSCRCYYSFHLLLRLLFFLRGQSSIQFPHYG